MRSRPFFWLWLGGVLAYAADLLLFTNLALWIIADLARQVSWVTLAAGGVTIAAALPVIVLGPTAGVFVDRWPKRRVVLWADAGRVLAVGGLTLLAYLSHALPLPSLLAMLYVLVVLASGCAQFFGPARFILFSHFVAAPQRAQAAALSQTTNNLILLLIPSAAPILYLGAGPLGSLLATTGLYGVAYLTLWLIPSVTAHQPATKVPPLLQEFHVGVRFLRAQPILRMLLIAITFQMIGGGIVNALNIFFLVQVVHAPFALLGLTATTTAVGAILGSSFALLFARRLNLLHLYVGSFMATSIGLLLYSRMTNFVEVLVLTGVFGVFQGMIAVPLAPLIMTHTPEHLLGRIIALFTSWQAISLTLGTAVAGMLATLLHAFHANVGPLHFGSIDSVVMLGAIIDLSGALYLWHKLRALVRLDEQLLSHEERVTVRADDVMDTPPPHQLRPTTCDLVGGD